MSEAPIWTPVPARADAARLWSLRQLVNQRYDVELPHTYGALQRWSTEYPGEFWACVWDDCQVPGDRGERLDDRPGAFETTRFLPDARLNVAEALLAGWDTRPGAAITFIGEDGERASLSGPELIALVGRIQRALRVEGVRAGDRVAAVVSNRPEGYALMIAAASIGAVFTSVSPDLGVDGIVDRLAQVEPVLLVGVARYFYAGKEHDVRPNLVAAAHRLPSVRKHVLVPAGAGDVRPSDLSGWWGWADWLDAAPPAPAGGPAYQRFGFDHPWYVLYSSGTTGPPKAIVHRAGGVLLKHLVEHRYQHDLGDGDRLCFFTTASWMMWNWQASALASGIGLVLYDGSPFHPDGGRLFDLVDTESLTALGVSPRFLDALRAAGGAPAADHDLDTLRLLIVTGSPLSAETARWVYGSVLPGRSAPAQLAAISGGTDLCGGIVGAEPTSPVYAGQMQAAGLGVGADVVDDQGASLPVGRRGELVVRVPFPSMPLGFWGDDEGTRYRDAYFDRFPGWWHHGDFCERTAEGGFVISGRSDATLNPGGVRIGTAEIYRQVAVFDEVVESAAIGLPGKGEAGDSAIALFLVLRPGLSLDDELTARIQARIRANLSPRHVPGVVVQAPDLPRTRSGKLSELAVRDVVHGRPVTNTSALANPESLEFFSGLEF
jgi:acetoacetyl-CoA synthetase